MFKSATIISICLIAAGTVAQAQQSTNDKPVPQQPGAKPPAKAPYNPYANLPPRDKFNKGELEESFNLLMEQMESSFSDTKSVLETDHLNFHHYRYRLNYFAGHPYINDAVKIKTSWMLNAAKLMGQYYENARKYEIARIAGDKALIARWENFLKNNREAVLKYIKNPEKLDKDDKDNAKKQ